MKRTEEKDAYDDWDKNMPVLLMSGGGEPVGDNGKGVESVKKSMMKAGISDITAKVYPDGRHDILHEEKLGMAQLISDEIKNWMLNHHLTYKLLFV